MIVLYLRPLKKWGLVLALFVSTEAFLPLTTTTRLATTVDYPLPNNNNHNNNHHHNNNNIFALHAKKKKKKSPGGNTISVNRVAYRNYEVLDTLEAGISLKGTEVKAIRDGKLNLRDGYVRPSKNGRSCILYNVHIGKHNTAGIYFQHEETRPRPLLVHKEEARKWQQKTEQAGMTIVPLKAYFAENNKVKIQIALCRGKNVRDKRQDIKERDAKREENRIIKSFRM